MSQLKLGVLSNSDVREAEEALRQIADGERKLAEVALRQAKGTGSTVTPDEKSATVTLIKDGAGRVIGFYLDPPGACYSVP